MEGRLKNPSNKHCGVSYDQLRSASVGTPTSVPHSPTRSALSWNPQSKQPRPGSRLPPGCPPRPESRRRLSPSCSPAGPAPRSPSRLRDTTPPLQADLAGSGRPDVLATGWGRGRSSNSSTQDWKSLGSRPGRESDTKRKLGGAAGLACLQNGERRFLSQIERPRGLFRPGERAFCRQGDWSPACAPS